MKSSEAIPGCIMPPTLSLSKCHDINCRPSVCLVGEDKGLGPEASSAVSITFHLAVRSYVNSPLFAWPSKVIHCWVCHRQFCKGYRTIEWNWNVCFCVWLYSQDPASLSLLSISDLVPDLQFIFFWMSNAIEILYFIQQKSPTYMQAIELMDDKGMKWILMCILILQVEKDLSKFVCEKIQCSRTDYVSTDVIAALS